MKNKNSHPYFPCSAFTLVELMVVIAIIGLLAGLIIPAMKTSVVKARSASSMSNLRQIMAAVNLFGADHEGRLPFGDSYHTDLKPYLQNPLNVYTVFTSRNADRQPEFDSTTTARIPITYSMHGWLTDDGSGRGRLAAVMEKPAQIILIADGVQARNNYWQANWRFENPREFVMESRRADYTEDELRQPVTETGPDAAVDSPGAAGWFRYCNNGQVACAFGDGHAALIKKNELLVENLVP